MGSQPRITGQLFIPEFFTTGPTGGAGNVSNGSSVVTSVSNINLLIPGLTVTGTGIPPSTTVVSVNYGASSFVMSANGTANNTGVTISTSCGDGVFYCEATYTEVNGVYSTADLSEGFLVTNSASDAGSGSPLSGVFNTFVINKVTARPSYQYINYFCTYDEDGSYSTLNRIPTNATYSAISQQSDYRAYQNAVSTEVYPNLPGGIAEAAYNIDVLAISDYAPVIIGQTGQQINGAWYVGFTGAGVTVTETGDQYNTVTVTIPGGSGGGSAINTYSSGSQIGVGVTGLNFTGSGVSSVTDSSGYTTITISGGTGSGSSGTSGISGAARLNTQERTV